LRDIDLGQVMYIYATAVAVCKRWFDTSQIQLPTFFTDVVLTARYFYVTAFIHLTKDFDDLIYGVSFFLHVSGRF
jgi:hypothetical protein